MGIEQERFVTVSQELVCCICAGVLEDPVESPCRHVFCSECISTWLNTRPSCPNCRKVVVGSDLKPALPLIKNIIAKLQIHCDFVEQGCNETVDLEQLKTHCNSCPFAPISCGNEGCEVNFQRKDRGSHESDCPYRRVVCTEGCGMNVAFPDLASHNCVENLKCVIKELEGNFSAKIDQLSQKVSALEETVNSLKGRARGRLRHRTQRGVEQDNDSGLISLYSETDDPAWSPASAQGDSDSHSDDNNNQNNFIRSVRSFTQLLVEHINQLHPEGDQGGLPQSSSNRDRSRSRSPLRVESSRSRRRNSDSHQGSATQGRSIAQLLRRLSQSPRLSDSSHDSNNDSPVRRRSRRSRRFVGRTSPDGTANNSGHNSSGSNHTPLGFGRDTENNSGHDSSGPMPLGFRRVSTRSHHTNGNSYNLASPTIDNDASVRDTDNSVYDQSLLSPQTSDSSSSDSSSSSESASSSHEEQRTTRHWLRQILGASEAVSSDNSYSSTSS